MKHFLLLIMVLFGPAFAFAQVNSLEQAIINQEYTSDWVLFEQTDNVDVYYQYGICEEVYDCCEMLFFKVVNKSENVIDLSWQFNLGWREYVNNPVTSSSERDVHLIIQPEQQVSTSCTNENNAMLIFIIRELVNPEWNVLTAITINQLTENQTISNENIK